MQTVQFSAPAFKDEPVMSIEDFCDMMSAQDRAAESVAPVTPRPSTFSTGPTTPAEEDAYFASCLKSFREMARDMNATRQTSAAAEHAFYNYVYGTGKVVDGYYTKVKIQKAGRLDNVRYEIDRMASTCTCPDFVERIEPLRRQMVGVGASELEAKCLCCRHLFIVEEKIAAGTIEALPVNPAPVVVTGRPYNGHHAAMVSAMGNVATAANAKVSRQEQINREFC